ncbi:glycosyltransferase family 39 protein [bacterium]|nr:glycosyltransferase family 39 protein [bacterium]
MNAAIANSEPSRHSFLLGNNAILLYLGLFKFLLHLLTSGGYGYFRDEFYYIACSEHLAFGYVDQPPLSIAFLWLNRLILGDSLFALRFLPALSGGVVVVLTGLMARELGGNRFAQVLAAIAIIIAPVNLFVHHFFSMNCFDYLFWALAMYIIIRILKEENLKLWLMLGLVLGLGLMNKISVLWLGAGLFAGLLLTSNRKTLLTIGPWLAAVLATLLFLPHILWQISNHWPTIEFMRNVSQWKMLQDSPIAFFFEQILLMNPITFPIWMLGLLFLLFAKKMKPFRVLGIIYLTVFLILVLNRTSRASYLAAAYPILFAAGALNIADFFKKQNMAWLKSVSISLLVIGGIALAPFGLPVLPVETYIAYAKKIGIEPPSEEKKELGKLPQLYADMFGWENMVATVADVYHSLPPEEKSECVIMCGNYGEAGAIDFFGSKYNLPKAISGHNNYWLWGPKNLDGNITITLGLPREHLEFSFESVEQAAIIHSEYAMPFENDLPVYLCRHIKFPLQQIWPQTKHYE